MLPGFAIPAIFETAAAGITLDSANSTTSTSQNITAPAVINAGDLLVLIDFATDLVSVPTKVVPTNFTEILEENDSNKARYVASYKIADGTEDGASITGMNGNMSNDKVLYRFVPSSAISSVTVGSENVQITDGNPGSQTCVASGGTPALVVCASYSSSGDVSGDSRTFSTTADGESNSSTRHYFKYKFYNASPADTTVDMGDHGTHNTLSRFYLEVS